MLLNIPLKDTYKLKIYLKIKKIAMPPGVNNWHNPFDFDFFTVSSQIYGQWLRKN